MPKALLYGLLRVINLDGLDPYKLGRTPSPSISLFSETHVPGATDPLIPLPPSPDLYTVPLALSVCRDLLNILRLISMLDLGLGMLQKAKHFPSILSK